VNPLEIRNPGDFGRQIFAVPCSRKRSVCISGQIFHSFLLRGEVWGRPKSSRSERDEIHEPLANAYRRQLKEGCAISLVIFFSYPVRLRATSELLLGKYRLTALNQSRIFQPIINHHLPSYTVCINLGLCFCMIDMSGILLRIGRKMSNCLIQKRNSLPLLIYTDCPVVVSPSKQ
jgi:hypothetical protein